MGRPPPALGINCSVKNIVGLVGKTLVSQKHVESAYYVSSYSVLGTMDRVPAFRVHSVSSHSSQTQQAAERGETGHHLLLTTKPRRSCTPLKAVLLWLVFKGVFSLPCPLWLKQWNFLQIRVTNWNASRMPSLGKKGRKGKGKENIEESEEGKEMKRKRKGGRNAEF